MFEWCVAIVGTRHVLKFAIFFSFSSFDQKDTDIKTAMYSSKSIYVNMVLKLSLGLLKYFQNLACSFFYACTIYLLTEKDMSPSSVFHNLIMGFTALNSTVPMFYITVDFSQLLSFNITPNLMKMANLCPLLGVDKILSAISANPRK